MNSQSSNSLWGGRFSAAPDRALKHLNDSLRYDWRLWRQDIEGSLAYACELGRAGAMDSEGAERIASALTQLKRDIECGVAQPPADAEDVHTAIERMLAERIGPVAGKLHTGRSRNDQVATDTRMYVREVIAQTSELILRLQQTLATLAEREIETVMPGYTHLQHAQPVLLSHHLLAYFWMLERDKERLEQLLGRVNVMPLGAGALAGSTVCLDRLGLAAALGFERVCENSLDAVSDRDYVIEFLSAASILLMHLSRFGEEIVLWNSREFGFIELDDSVATGSSMMPQKKNPDIAELARAKPGRVYGHLIGMLTVMKGLPLSYNKDLQEDKEVLFDTADTLFAVLPAFDRMLSTVRFNRERMRGAIYGDFSTATDVADFLVKGGTPFREAHEIVGRIVRHCEEHGKSLEDLEPTELAAFSNCLENAPSGWEAVVQSLKARNIEGGTGPDAVKAQLERAKSLITPNAG